MESTPYLIFLVPSSINNYLFIYVFARGVDREIRYVVTTKMKNIPYISARVTGTINLSIEETWMLTLNMRMLSVLEGSKYLT